MMSNMPFMTSPSLGNNSFAQQQQQQGSNMQSFIPNSGHYLQQQQQGMTANGGFLLQQQNQQLMQQMSAISGMQDNSILPEHLGFSNPGFPSHLFQNQALTNHQFRQEPTPDWRSMLSTQDRNHVTRQLYPCC